MQRAAAPYLLVTGHPSTWQVDGLRAWLSVSVLVCPTRCAGCSSMWVGAPCEAPVPGSKVVQGSCSLGNLQESSTYMYVVSLRVCQSCSVWRCKRLGGHDCLPAAILMLSCWVYGGLRQIPAGFISFQSEAQHST